MSIKLMSMAYDAAFPDIELDNHTVKASTSKAVCIALADHASEDGKGAYPSIETLCNKTEYERRTVQRALDALIKMEIIKLVGVSEYRTDNYTVNQHTLSMMKRNKEGDSGAEYGISGQKGGDSGTHFTAPESPESSSKPSEEPSFKPCVPQIVFEKANKAVDYILGSLSPKAIQDAMATYFKLTPNWETKSARQWMQWAMNGSGVTSEKIEAAADRWRRDKLFNWSVPTLKGIQEHWLELTSDSVVQEPKAFTAIREFMEMQIND